jgi:hypothetical protein
MRLGLCVAMVCALAGSAPGDEVTDELIRQAIQKATTDAKRAEALYYASRKSKLMPEVQIALLEKSLEYAMKAAGKYKGQAAVKKVLDELERKAPERRDEWGRRRVEYNRVVYRQAVDRKDKYRAGSKLVEVLLKASAPLEQEGKWVEAMALLTEANTVAGQIDMKAPKMIAARLQRAQQFRAALEKAAEFILVLKRSPDNTAVRVSLLTQLMVELNAPALAAKHLADDVGDVWNTYVPLAAGPVDELKGLAAKELGDWYYRELRPKALSDRAKADMLKRSSMYYTRFLATEPADETDVMVAKMAVALIAQDLGQTPSAPAPAGDVPSGVVAFGGHHYKVVLKRGKWREALGACQKAGGHLVIAETKEEMTFLKKLAGKGRLWVGASDVQNEGDWRWLSGKSVPRLPSYWVPGQPNGKRDQNIASLTSGGLLDTPPGFQAVTGYICEWDK